MERLNRITGNLWLAEQVGRDPVTVSKWCTNTSQPDLQTLARIADALRIDMRSLIADRQHQL